MANLIGMPRVTLRRQPTRPVDIDWNNPLSWSLKSAFLPVGNNLIEVISNRIGTTSANVRPAVGHFGYGINTTSAAVVFADPGANSQFDLGPNPTVIAAFQALSTSTTGAVLAKLFGTTVPYVLSPSISSNPFGFAIYAASWISSGWTTDTRADLKPHVAAGQFIKTNPNGLNVYLDGKLDKTVSTAGTGATAADNNTNLSFGIYSGTYFDGIIYGAWLFSDFLSDVALIELTGNPWQLFKPRIARFISIPSSGPVTFQPAWARLRSLIIGSGV